jgi:glucokinase
MESKIVLGVDIGGSHITATLVDLKSGNIIENSEVREPVNAKGSSDEIVSLWANVIKRTFANQNICVGKVGIAMPGPFDYDAGIAWMKNQDKYDSLYGLNVKNLLATSLNISPQSIRFLNDAESFLKGEAFSGAAKGATKAIGLTLGTGLGSARYVKGNVEDADLWHSPFLDGIAEDYLSTRWFVSRYYAVTGKTISGVKELSELASNKTVALETFAEFGFHLALFVNEVIKKDGPEVIVIGGNIAHAFPLFEDELTRQLHKLRTNVPAIKKAALGEEASLIGAASCWANVEEEILEYTQA